MAAQNIDSPDTHRRRRPIARRYAVLLASLVLAGSAVGILTLSLLLSHAATAAEVTLYKSPWCGCCGNWAEHLRANDFHVKVISVEEMAPIKARFGITPELESCHTAVVDGYVVEGHVPAADILQLLAERPAARGLAVPGMPAGSPGMEGADREPFNVMIFDAGGQSRVYASY